MKLVITRLWNEQAGAIVSAEILMIGTILVLGVIVGLKSVRDSVVSELADLAQAIGNANQAYAYSGVGGHSAFSNGSAFDDRPDFCEGAHHWQESKCVSVGTWSASFEGF
jgi:hypothetical protein